MNRTERIKQIKDNLQRLADLKATASPTQIISISREERGLNWELKNLEREEEELKKKAGKAVLALSARKWKKIAPAMMHQSEINAG